jgi:DNA repair exonuclease SbcCD nuclease subunit
MKFIGTGDLHTNIWDKNNNSFKHITKTFQFLKSFIVNKEADYLILFGDLFDTKIMTSTEGLINLVKIIDELSEIIKIIIIVGNHDIAKSDDIEINLPNVFANKNNITVVDKFYSFEDEVGVYNFLPYYKDEVLIDEIEKIKTNKKKNNYLFGHFGVNGYVMNDYEDGQVLDKKSKITPGFLKKFNHTFLGHFHGFQRDDLITYIGSPLQLRFGDELSSHGFYYHDFNNNSHEFVENKFSPQYIKLKVNKSNLEKIKEIKKVGNHYVKLIIPAKMGQQKAIKLKFDLLKNNYDVKLIFEETLNNEFTVIEGWDNLVKQDTEYIIKDFAEMNLESFNTQGFNKDDMINLILN